MKKISVKEFLTLFIFSVFILMLIPAGVNAAQSKVFSDTRKKHTVYFENTDYELDVYEIFGEKKGKTIMIIGGIQGDEPGGFLTADSYADISLEKGSLIVVPRANLPSILMKKRSINVDMNRKFADEGGKDYEGKIVKILKELISKSDCLLNLHDGSGFFSPVWVDDMKNPLRFGQSIITDFKKYKISNGEELDLENMAKRVVVKVNEKIKNKNHHFNFNNHRTSESSSPHKEQRKSATYFAVTKCDIPAFGIETSKSLSIVDKVRHHQYAINAFFDEFGIIPELPPLGLEKPELKYLVVTVNNNPPLVLNKGEILNIKKGSTLRVSHIEANYTRGLSVDFIDIGKKNDIRKAFKIEKDVRIVARKDYEPCGSVYVKVVDSLNEKSDVLVSKKSQGDYFYFKTRINEKDIRLIENKGSITLEKGDLFEIVDVVSGKYDPSELEVNIKGFVSNRDYNTGEDRGAVVDTGKDFWVRYSLKGKGFNYPVIVSKGNKKIGKMFIKLEKPCKKFLILKSADKKFIAVAPGADLKISSHEKLKFDSVSGIGKEKFFNGSYSLKIRGRNIDLNNEPLYLDDLLNNDGKNSEIKLIRNFKNKKRVEARFIIKK